MKPVAWINIKDGNFTLDWKKNEFAQKHCPLYNDVISELTEWEIKECWEEATEMREHFCSQYFDFAQLILKKAREK